MKMRSPAGHKQTYSKQARMERTQFWEPHLVQLTLPTSNAVVN